MRHVLAAPEIRSGTRLVLFRVAGELTRVISRCGIAFVTGELSPLLWNLRLYRRLAVEPSLAGA